MNNMLQTPRKTVRRLFDNLERTLFPRRYNLRTCSVNGTWNQYFTDAEAHMDVAWETIIWPIIKDGNFDCVLELAPGAGRNTAKLAAISREIHAVDLNEYALAQLRERFANYDGPCKLHFHKNDGTHLGMLGDASISFIYCWDAAVHFDKMVVRDYIKEFARIMRPGAIGFIHHSNLGDAADVDISKNPHWRSNMTKERFAEYCSENKLDIVQQTALPWHPPVNGIVYYDCLSVFKKPLR
jgi:ubiquinone/menaquinone biosynthesis C-methylase UbiE